MSQHVVITSGTPWHGHAGTLLDSTADVHGFYKVRVKQVNGKPLELAMKEDEFKHPNSWKVGCKDDEKCPTWSYNALRFATWEDADLWGADLASRWMALAAWEVHPSDDPPNR